jgi:hypothetical protein
MALGTKRKVCENMEPLLKGKVQYSKHHWTMAVKREKINENDINILGLLPSPGKLKLKKSPLPDSSNIIIRRIQAFLLLGVFTVVLYGPWY